MHYMSTFTLDQLANLKKAYARGVLRVRDGDQWIEYQTSDQMLKAIDRMEAELGVNGKSQAPRGMRRTKFSRAR